MSERHYSDANIKSMSASQLAAATSLAISQLWEADVEALTKEFAIKNRIEAPDAP